MHTLALPFLNFSILVAALVYFLRTPVKQFVAQRHVFLRDELSTVRERLRQSQERYEEFSSKLKAIDAELVDIRKESAATAQATRSKIVTEARRLAGNIVSDARFASEALYGELKGQLYSELGARVLDRAEVILRERLTGDDRDRIRQEFSKQVETIR